METKTRSQNVSAPFDRKSNLSPGISGKEKRRERRGNTDTSALCRVLVHKLSHLIDCVQ